MEVSNTTRWIFTICNFLAISLSITPLLVYYIHKFNQRKDVFITKRYPNLVLASSVLICIGIPVNITLQSFRWLSPVRQQSMHKVFNIYGRINVAFGHPIIYAINGLFLCRFWLMFYDLNYSNSHINKKWKSHLNPALVSKDFWIKYRTTYGSSSTALKISCVLFVVMSLPGSVYGQIHFPPDQTILNYVTIPIHLLLMISYLVLALRAPNIYDLFHIRFELKALVTIIFVSILLVYSVQPMINSSNAMVELIGRMIRIDVSVLGYGSMGLTSTWWIVNKLDNTFNAKYKAHPQRQSALELQRVLLDPHNFELFAQHLAREFAIETLLAFIEFLQFKHVIDDMFHLDHFLPRDTFMEDEEANESEKQTEKTEMYFNYTQCDIRRNKVVPKSVIVHPPDYNQVTSDDLKPFLKIAHQLHNKYIKTGGELEINISGESRDVYVIDMECSLETFADKQLKCDSPMEPVDLFEYFDGVIEEMYCLLTTSCNRFLETDKNMNIARIQLTNYDSLQIENTFRGKKV